MKEESLEAIKEKGALLGITVNSEQIKLLDCYVQTVPIVAGKI